jgi:hypothetical protein
MLGETLGEKPRAHPVASPPPHPYHSNYVLICYMRYAMVCVLRVYAILYATSDAYAHASIYMYMYLYLHHPSGHEVAIGTAVDLEKSSSYDVMLKIRTYISTQ